MKTVKVEMMMVLTDEGAKNIKRIENHVEDLLDLDNWNEIETVYGVTVTECD